MFNRVMIPVTEPSPPTAQRVQGLPKFAKFAVIFGFGEEDAILGTVSVDQRLKKVDIDCKLHLMRAALMPDRAIVTTHSERDGALKAEHFHIS